MKTTAFYQQHIAHKAKMIEFAGYNMPVSYSSLNDEHHCVRKKVGVFDVSHMGEFIIKGKNAKTLLQSITSNDIHLLSPGKAQYSCLPNDKGGIVDDLLVYQLDEETFMLVVNASNMIKDWEWISSQNQHNTEMKNISEQTSLLAIQGPQALPTIQKLTKINLSEIPYYHFTKGIICDEEVLISNTGYTGAGGFELYFKNEAGQKIWDAIFDAGKEFGIQPIGLGARDTLRLEMGFCLYGNDIDDHTSPIEAGLGWITKFNKDFFGKSLFEKQKKEGVTKKLVGFEMIERGIPRHGYELTDKSGKTIGIVTSGTQSPTLQKAIGMGYVEKSNSSPGSEIFVKIRDNIVKALVVKVPFLKF